MAEAFEFRLADVGEGLHEAEVRRWLVAPGDPVALDQSIVEVETDKAVVELPSPVAGTVLRLGGEEGAILHVGEIVAVLAPEEFRVSSFELESAEPGSSLDASVQPESVETQTSELGTPAGRALATPAVRKLARDLGVDLTHVPATGPGGRVSAADIEGFARSNETHETEGAPSPAAPSPTEDQPRSAPPPPTPGDRRSPLRGLRRRIAQSMTQAWTTIPHITGFDEIDVTALVALRARLQPAAEQRGLHLSYLPFVVKAAALTLREFPIVNASLDEAASEVVYHAAAHIGIATATPDGLIVPVLHAAGDRTLLEIQAAIDALGERARTRTATPDELRGGTFTITNFGALGGWQAAPIIRPGEAAILGIGRIQPRPWVVDDRIEPRPILALSLAADHRLIDGDVSTAFLARIGALLTEPGLLLLELR